MQKLQIWKHIYLGISQWFKKGNISQKIATVINTPEQQVFRDDSSARPTTKLTMKIVIFFV